MNNIEKEISAELKTLAGRPTISNMISNLERDDINAQSQAYKALMDQEAQTLINQLRHRAQMMRIRAEEFDGIADNMEKFSRDLATKVDTFCSTHANTAEILQAHAHINPSKVTNGDK